MQMITVLPDHVEQLVVIEDGAMITAFANFLHIDVANGDARPDTIRTYKTHVAQWVKWCTNNLIDPQQATQHDVKAYRQCLVSEGMKHATIALKLTTIRRFYQAAIDSRYIESNPADNVKPPRERQAVQDSMNFLSAGEAELLFRAIPKSGTTKALRDKAIIAIMALEGFRAIEVNRACLEDIETLPGGGTRILVHGKGKDGYIYPREDTLKAIQNYLVTRGDIPSDEQGTPLFTAVGNRAGGHRLTRDGIRDAIDFYLVKAGLKRQGLSCHGLRHTCGALLYQATRDIKVVQETLRHSDISTASRYSHIINRGEARYTNSIPISI